jgi:hypothetical protein
MYEDLTAALRCVASKRDVPEVNLFNIARMAEDCGTALEAMNAALAEKSAECESYRRDCIALSLIILGERRLPQAGQGCGSVYCNAWEKML